MSDTQRRLDDLERTIRAAGETVGSDARDTAERAVRMARDIPRTVRRSAGHQMVLIIAAACFAAVVLLALFGR